MLDVDMTVDDLVRELAAYAPAAVPELLKGHLGFVLAHLNALFNAVADQPDPPVSVMVGTVWLTALTIGGETLLARSPWACIGRIVPGRSRSSGGVAQRTLTPFGDALLTYVHHEAIEGKGAQVEARPPPGQKEVDRLGVRLWEYVKTEDPRELEALVLGQLICAAINLIPRALQRSRERFADTALVHAAQLEAVATPDARSTYTDLAHALRASAATIIPPDKFMAAQTRAFMYYLSLPFRRDANKDA